MLLSILKVLGILIGGPIAIVLLLIGLVLVIWLACCKKKIALLLASALFALGGGFCLRFFH